MGGFMNIRTAVMALMAITLSVMPGFTQSSIPLLVDTAWLSDHLKDSNLVVLHVGAKQEYDAEHIPGARHITDGDITLNNAEHIYDLPEAADLRAKLAGSGSSDDSRIVVYFGSNGGLAYA